MKRVTRALVFLACACLVSTTAFAQGANSSTSLSGTVKDRDGGVVPGAQVSIKNNATAVVANTQTNGQGVYSFPTLDAGTYTITV